MDATHNTAFTTMICGLVTDGIITGTMAGSATAGATACGSLIDILYIYATDTSGHALLNLCSTAFTGVAVSSPTFTANAGFLSTGAAWVTSGSTTGTDTTGYVPSTAGGNCVQNSCSIGNWSFTASSQALFTAGGANGGLGLTMEDDESGSAFCTVNAGSSFNGVVTDGSGFFVCNRSASNAEQLYRNAVSVATSAVASTGITAQGINMNGYNSGGGSAASNRQIAMAFVGASLSSGQVTAINSRVCTYLTTVHGSC